MMKNKPKGKNNNNNKITRWYSPNRETMKEKWLFHRVEDIKPETH